MRLPIDPALALVALSFLSACGDNQDPAGADELFLRIQTLAYRATFAKAPGYETQQPSNTSHSAFSDIFLNPISAKVIADNTAISAWPLGSLIVKDGYDDDGIIELIAVMEKRSDGWYWAEYLDPTASAGGASYSGKPSVCIDCHQSAADDGNDFTRAIVLPK